MERTVMLVIIGVILFLFWFFFIACLIEHREANKLQARLNVYELEIKKLHEENERQIKAYYSSKKKADESIKTIDSETEKLYASKIPTDCEKAIEWGSKQAKGF